MHDTLDWPYTNTLEIKACNLQFIHRGVICFFIINVQCCNYSLIVHSLILFLISFLESQYWF